MKSTNNGEKFVKILILVKLNILLIISDYENNILIIKQECVKILELLLNDFMSN